MSHPAISRLITGQMSGKGADVALGARKVTATDEVHQNERWFVLAKWKPVSVSITFYGNCVLVWWGEGRVREVP